MTKQKKEEKNKEKVIVIDAKEQRRLAWEAKQIVENKKENSREEFRKFFIKIKGKLSLAQDMEEVVWKHFKAAGFDKKEKFEEGIKHFGYQL